MITPPLWSYEREPQEYRAVSLLTSILVAVAACSPFPGYDYVILAGGSITYLYSLFSAARYGLRSADFAPAPVLLLMFLSFAWSELPEATIRLAGTFLVLAMVISRLSRMLGASDLVNIVATGLRLTLMASLVFAAIRPSAGLVEGDYATGALQGIYNHRNFLAFACVVLIVCRLPLLLQDKVTLSRVIDLVLAVVCLIAAQSQTSLLTAAAAFLLIATSRLVSRYRPAARATIWLAISLGTGVVIQLLLANFASVTQGLGRDTTLTGRTDVWAAVLEEIPRHLWFGAGWGAVWQEGLPTSARMWSNAGFRMYHSHDGYFDLTLNIGLIGLMLYLSIVLAALGKALVNDVGDRPFIATWVSATCAALLVSSVAESPFSTPFGWVVTVAAFSAAIARRDRLAPSKSTVSSDSYHRMG